MNKMNWDWVWVIWCLGWTMYFYVANAPIWAIACALLGGFYFALWMFSFTKR